MPRKRKQNENKIRRGYQGVRGVMAALNITSTQLAGLTGLPKSTLSNTISCRRRKTSTRSKIFLTLFGLAAGKGIEIIYDQLWEATERESEELFNKKSNSGNRRRCAAASRDDSRGARDGQDDLSRRGMSRPGDRLSHERNNRQ